jgi:hypothetical protein
MLVLLEYSSEPVMPPDPQVIQSAGFDSRSDQRRWVWLQIKVRSKGSCLLVPTQRSMIVFIRLHHRGSQRLVEREPGPHLLLDTDGVARAQYTPARKSVPERVVGGFVFPPLVTEAYQGHCLVTGA